jgi:hypothetical protein
VSRSASSKWGFTNVVFERGPGPGECCPCTAHQKIITLISLVPSVSTCSKRYEGTQIIRLFPILLILPRNSMAGSGSFAAAAAATCFFGFGC